MVLELMLGKLFKVKVETQFYTSKDKYRISFLEYRCCGFDNDEVKD